MATIRLRTKPKVPMWSTRPTYDLSLITLSSSPTNDHLTCSASATLDYFLFLEDVKHGSMSGSLHLLFPLQETLFLPTAIWLSTALYSNICLNVTSSEAFHDPSILNSIPALHSHLTLFYFYSMHISFPNIV